MALKPSDLKFEEAAVIPYGGLIAAHFIKKADIKKQQKVLIYGASGAIGTSAVQLASYFGAELTGVCSTKNIELVKSMGAHKVIDYTSDNINDVKDRYDFILDAVGKKKSSELKKQLKNVLAPNGKITSVDNGSPTGTLQI